jgi:hypothetical protein
VVERRHGHFSAMRPRAFLLTDVGREGKLANLWFLGVIQGRATGSPKKDNV